MFHYLSTLYTLLSTKEISKRHKYGANAPLPEWRAKTVSISYRVAEWLHAEISALSAIVRVIFFYQRPLQPNATVVCVQKDRSLYIYILRIYVYNIQRMVMARNTIWLHLWWMRVARRCATRCCHPRNERGRGFVVRNERSIIYRSRRHSCSHILAHTTYILKERGWERRGIKNKEGISFLDHRKVCLWFNNTCEQCSCVWRVNGSM